MPEEELVVEALDLMGETPKNFDIGPAVVGNDRYYMLLLSELAEQVPLNREKDRISAMRIQHEVDKLLKDAKKEERPVSHFEEKVSEWVSEIKKSGMTEYQLFFPLNISPNREFPEEFETQEGTIRRVDIDKWENKKDKAEYEDEKYLDKFLRKFPNKFEEGKHPHDEEFTYWETKCEARGGNYAFSLVDSRLRLLLGKINYATNFQNLRPRQTNGSFLPRLRWSELRRAPVYLMFDDQDYLGFRMWDLQHRKVEYITWDRESKLDKNPKERFNQLPSFDDNPDGVNKLIMNGFLSFQSGISSMDRSQSFFSFWRGIENLSRVERGESKKEAVSRAEFAREHTLQDIGGDPLLEDIDLPKSRNDLVHDIESNNIHLPHQEYAKLLLEGLLYFYMEYREELDSKKEFRRLLRYGSWDNEKKARVREILGLLGDED